MIELDNMAAWQRAMDREFVSRRQYLILALLQVFAVLEDLMWLSIPTSIFILTLVVISAIWTKYCCVQFDKCQKRFDISYEAYTGEIIRRSDWWVK